MTLRIFDQKVQKSKLPVSQLLAHPTTPNQAMSEKNVNFYCLSATFCSRHSVSLNFAMWLFALPLCSKLLVYRFSYRSLYHH